mgnify:CR=1 FL=1
MKSYIMYYYNFDEIEITKKAEVYYFRNKNSLYSFETVKSPKKSEKLFSYLSQIGYHKGFKIIFNIYHNMFTNIEDKWYVLILHSESDFNLLTEVLSPVILPRNFFDFEHYSWDYLWSRKVDYYEYQISHFGQDYPLILESFNYYIGMAENAISYLRYNISSQQLRSLDMFLCHERISYSNYFNPTNFIMDFYARDVAEYIKFLFFSDSYHNFSFHTFFQSLNFSYSDYILLYSRLLFPSYYFDIYDDIINKKCNENKLKKVIYLQKDYQSFLYYIYKVIISFIYIPEVGWIRKEMS